MKKSRKGTKDTKTIDIRNRLLSLYSAVFEEIAYRDVVSISWEGPELTALPQRDMWKEETEAAGWTLSRRPKHGLIPQTGFTSMATENAAQQVMVVAAFGRSGAEIANALKEIEARQSESNDFRPVFFVNTSDFDALRKSGYSFEYFPLAECEHFGFQTRFERLWRKWSATYLLDMSEAGFLRDRLEELAELIQPRDTNRYGYTPLRLETPQLAAPPDIVALRADYMHTDLAIEVDTFVLYRILGNDLPPRHQKGQALENLRFILEHEPNLERCQKRFVLNRIFDAEAEGALVELLEAHGQAYDRLPFDLEEYRERTWDVESFPEPGFFLRGAYSQMSPYAQMRAEAFARRHKNRYAIHNNGARNFALRQGRDLAKWVLPWDGNCFVTQDAWQSLLKSIQDAPYYKYRLVPMARVTDNAKLLEPEFAPPAEEEPQVVFRSDTTEDFDDALHYGRRPKVELFYRLGIEGPWSTWRDDVWDLRRPELCEDAGSAESSSWVARLSSGNADQEVGGLKGARARGETRIEGVVGLLDRLDQQALRQHYDPSDLLVYDEDTLDRLAEGGDNATVDALRREADLAMAHGPYSVMDKAAVPPSGDKHDYFHPAPYWWPNPDTATGIPFIWRDGERVPGTVLYAPESDDFDRTRLQRVFDDGTVLALAWRATGEARYAQHAAKLIRSWFVDPATRMTPNLRYAQPRGQSADAEGSKTGVIEMKDLYFFLDAVRLAEQSAAFSPDDSAAFKEWLAEYLDWLTESPQAIAERKSANNHGTCYDVQTLAIAAYLGKDDLILSTLRTARTRLLEQFAEDGAQPHEIQRTQTAHYTAFNLQSWINLADMAARLGDQLGDFEAFDGRGLAIGLRWLFDAAAAGPWPHKQIEPFDRERLWPLLYAARQRSGSLEQAHLDRLAHLPPSFFAHDGIKPFWSLGCQQVPNRIWQSWSDLEDSIVAAERQLTTEALEAQHSAAPVKDLTKRLWGGHTKRALTDLYHIVASPTSHAKEVRRAYREIARWCHLQGDYQTALDCAPHMSLQAEDREVLHLQCDCLLHLHRNDEARTKLLEALDQRPDDVDLKLFLAKACGGLGSKTPMELQRQDATPMAVTGMGCLNDIYADHGLVELEEIDMGAGHILPRSIIGETPTQTKIPIARVLQDSGFAVDDQRYATNPQPKISVIIPMAESSETEIEGWQETLRSIVQQTVEELELIFVTDEGQDPSDALHTDWADRKWINIVHAYADCNALNSGLALATSELITVAQAGSLWHPDLLRLQRDAIRPGSHYGALAFASFLDATGMPLASWRTDLNLTCSDPASALLQTAAVRAVDGWDDAVADPHRMLQHRLNESGPDKSRALVLPGVPLIFLPSETAQRAHLQFPYGRARDEFRAITRTIAARKAAAEVATDSESGSESVSPYASIRAKEVQTSAFSHVFVGDFSESGLWSERLVVRVNSMLEQEPNRDFGILHIPRYERPGARLRVEFADWLEAGQLQQISAFETNETQVMVICDPYLLHDWPDGLDALTAERVDVLSAGPKTAAEKASSGRHLLPSTSIVKDRLRSQATWRRLV